MGGGFSTLHQLLETREQSRVLLVEPEKCLRHLRADKAVHTTWSLLVAMTCWFCDSACTQVIHMSSKFLQRSFGRMSPEPLSDSTFLDTESLAGEKRVPARCSLEGVAIKIWDVACG